MTERLKYYLDCKSILPGSKWRLETLSTKWSFTISRIASNENHEVYVRRDGNHYDSYWGRLNTFKNYIQIGYLTRL